MYFFLSFNVSFFKSCQLISNQVKMRDFLKKKFISELRGVHQLRLLPPVIRPIARHLSEPLLWQNVYNSGERGNLGQVGWDAYCSVLLT